MSDVALRIILRVSVITAFALLIVLWRVFRSGKWPKIIILGLLLATVMVLVINEFGGSFMGKFIDPEVERRQLVVADFIDNNRTRIDEVGRRLELLRELVARDTWPAEGQSAVEDDTAMRLLLWAHQLRGEESDDFQVVSSDLWILEDMIEFAADRNAIYPLPVDEMTTLLVKAEGSRAMIAEVEEVIDADVASGRFARAIFTLAVVDVKTGTIIAHGRGEATNSAAVDINAPRHALMKDLWHQLNIAALALAHRLTRGPR